MVYIRACEIKQEMYLTIQSDQKSVKSKLLMDNASNHKTVKHANIKCSVCSIANLYIFLSQLKRQILFTRRGKVVCNW